MKFTFTFTRTVLSITAFDTTDVDIYMNQKRHNLLESIK